MPRSTTTRFRELLHSLRGNPEQKGRRRKLQIAVVGILALGAALPLVGVSWGLPYIYHPDEPVDLGRVHDMVLNRTLKPPRFGYPSLYFYIQLFTHSCYIAIGETLGWFKSASAVHMPFMETAANGFTRDPNVFMTARVTTVVLQIALVGVTMWLGWALSRRRTTAVLAGLLVAIQPIMTHNARFATPDTLAGLTTTAAIIAAVYVARNPTTRNYLVAGCAIGLATGSKYNCFVVAVSLLAAYAIGSKKHLSDAPWVVWAGFAAVGFFLLTTPFAVIDPHKFWHDVHFVLQSYNRKVVSNQSPLQTNLRWLWDTTGPLLFLVFGVWWVRRDRKLLVVPLAFVVAYMALLSRPGLRFERNLMPAIPALLAVVAVVAVELTQRFTAGRRVSFDRAIVVVVVLLVAWPLLFAGRDSITATHDERAAARSWISDNMPAGAKIMVEVYSPYVNPTRYKVLPVSYTLISGVELRKQRPDAAIITGAGSGVRKFGGGVAEQRSQATLRYLQRKACQYVSFNKGATRIQIFRLRCPARGPSS